MSASNHQRRNRWNSSSHPNNNDNNNNDNHHHNNNNHNNKPPPVPVPIPPPGVSDEDALQALLSSANEREQERTGANDDPKQRGGGAGAGDRRRPIHHKDSNSNAPNKRPRRDDIGPSGRQRLPENDSYYGPADADQRPDNNDLRRRRRRDDDDEEGGPKKVDDDDDDDDDNDEDDEEKKKPTHKANFGLSGALAKDSGNGGGTGGVYKGVVLKFQEPPEARAPNTQWRFYVFKGKDLLETLHIAKQSAYLLGRNPEIADIAILHPSLSSQHAVLQYRALPNQSGNLQCQPYLMDLESTNGTTLNGVKLDAARYYQLKKGDVLTFGASTREYVLMTENTTSISSK